MFAGFENARATTLDLQLLPKNAWVRVYPEYVPCNGGEGKHRPWGYNKLVYDSVGKRLVYFDRWSGPRWGRTIYANAVLTFDVAENVVICHKANNWTRIPAGRGGEYQTVPLAENEKEPTPCDRHPYGNLAFVARQNALYLSAGANQSAKMENRKSHEVTSDTWSFNFATNRWSRVNSDPNPPQKLEDAMEYDVAEDKIVALVAGGKETWLLDVETGKWARAYAKNNPQSGMGAAMAFDTKRERIMVFGGPGRHVRGEPRKRWSDPGDGLFAYKISENVWVPLASAPVPVRAPSFAYDSKRDVAVSHLASTATMMFYFAAQDTWRVMKLADSDAGPRTAAKWHTLAYDEANDVLVRAAGPWNDPQWWVFRPNLVEQEATRYESPLLEKQ